MPDFQVKKQTKQYDAIIVGSGAGGGMAAYMLSQAGLKVCLLEAGPMYDPAKNVTQLKNPWESPRRGASTKFRPFGDFDASYWGWEIDGEPYTKKDGTQWDWWRARMLGGRTNHWGRISLRFGPKDFKRKSIDGLGDDWPIGYDDIKPFYDRIDKLIGIFGTREGLENEPDGIFLPPPKPRLHELMIKNAGQKAGVPVIPSRLSILTQKINEDRGQCFYCSQCNRGCTVYGDFSASSVLVKPAIKTGNVDVIPLAMAREVLTNSEGLATGVSYVSKEDLMEYQVFGRTVMAAAWWGNTCMILRVRPWAVSFRNCSDASATMKTGWEACMCILPGGAIIKSWISRADIISSTGVVWDNRPTVLVLVLKDSTGSMPSTERKKKRADTVHHSKRITGISMAQV